MAMPKRPDRVKREQAYREAFLARLNQQIAVRSQQYPTTRCWSGQALLVTLGLVQQAMAAEGFGPAQSNRSLLKWLCDIGLASPIATDRGAFYLLESRLGDDAEIDPFELLMAAKPAGVICYFSAVAFHELTTQVVAHHHVAELSPKVTVQAAPRHESPPSTKKRKTLSFGTLQFHYHGVPYYATRRSMRLVPGVATVARGPHERIRITTLEQTLLDSLFKPFHCGGPEVVFEAWREGLDSHRIDEDRLVSYLQAMDYPATARRLGALMEAFGVAPGAELRRHLETCRENIDRQNPHACISLLPGVQYTALNEAWLVKVP